MKKSPLGIILEENPLFFFDECEKTENSQMILTLYLIWERNKGAKSFYFQFLETYSKRTALSDWNDEDITNISSNYLKRQVYF